uniref:Uncharacterized protein n=1 Tax=Cacopsylla melanoneura TaxID=428564 RepID=A0A8D9AN76_9HEMI
MSSVSTKVTFFFLLFHMLHFSLGSADINPISNSNTFTNYEHPVPGDVLTVTQKTIICGFTVDATLCPVKGNSDPLCDRISGAVGGKKPRCENQHVCSFEMPPDNGPVKNITLSPYTTKGTPASPIVAMAREPNRAYLTTEDLDDLIIAKNCEKNGLFVFVPELVKGAPS